MIPLSEFKILFFSFAILLMASCSASRKAAKMTDPSALSAISVDSLLAKVAQNKSAIEWLNAKARITFKDDSQTRKFTATIRLKKDSVMWMNVKKLSVEAARILVDKDSVYVIDRLNKEYYIKSLEYLAEEYHLPADFEALQTMILGNPYYLPKQEYEVQQHPLQYQLIGKETKGMLSDYWINGQSFLLEQMSFLDLRNERKLEVSLGEYEALNEEEVFANGRIFTMFSEDTGDVKVDFKFVEVEPNVPKKMPFSISSRYKRVE